MTTILRSTLPPGALPALPRDSVKRVVLPNGLTVLFRRDTSAPVAAVVTYVKAGYFDETDDIVGIAHVLEHMFFKGTTKRRVGEIAKQTKAAGGYLNAHTIYDHTSYYAVLPARGFLEGLEVQADAYADSVIDARELAKELEVIIQEAKRKTDNPAALSTETLYELLHDRHRIRRWRIGKEDELRALSRDQLVAFYRNFYRPSNTILSVVGDLDEEETLRQIERLYGAIPDAGVTRSVGPSEDRALGFRCRELSGDVAETQLVLGWRTVPAESPDTPLLDIAATVLGAGRASRLYRAVRERQLAASVSAYDYGITEVGVFVVHAETTPEHTLQAGRAIWSQIDELRRNGPGESELERARRLYEARWVRRFETMEGQANYLAEWEAMGDWRLGDAFLERIMTATPAEVREVAERYLDPDQAGVVIYRPASAPPVIRSPRMLREELALGAPPLEADAPRPARMATPLSSTPLREREEKGVVVYRTNQGVPILVRRKPGAALASIGVLALGGAVEEAADEAGLTMLMARTATKGTATRTAAQIAEDAEMLGGSIGVSVSAESFGWSMTVPNARAAAAVELLADVVQRPSFPEEACETERTVAIADARMLRDDMYRWPLLLVERAWAGHPYGQPASGNESTLRNIGVGRILEWHAQRVLHAPIVLAIVGDVDRDEAAALLAGELSELRVADAHHTTPPEWTHDVGESVETRDKAQTALAIGFAGPSRSDDDRYAAALTASIASGLGGRFFDELRDRQSLAYTVNAFNAERRSAGMFVSYIATSPEKEDTARAGLLREFEKLRETPVTAEELRRAQRYAIGTNAIRQESSAAQLGDLLDAWACGTLAELSEFDAKVEEVTAARILEVARRYFDPERRVEGVVRGTGRKV
ncbi:MAG: insulinase family protein [Gemmatimonadaceae bacterium]|nr:insulinase family protein [Gemmatimonadaceae bacterium]